jgi:hypothetical protein
MAQDSIGTSGTGLSRAFVFWRLKLLFYMNDFLYWYAATTSPFSFHILSIRKVISFPSGNLCRFFHVWISHFLTMDFARCQIRCRILRRSCRTELHISKVYKVLQPQHPPSYHTFKVPHRGMSVQFFYEDGHGTVVDEHGWPEPMDDVVDKGFTSHSHKCFNKCRNRKHYLLIWKTNNYINWHHRQYW